MSGNLAAAEKLVNSFVNLQCKLGRPLETQVAQDPKDPKKLPAMSLRPTCLCLQCSTVSTIEDRDGHWQSRKHVFCR